MRVVRSPRSGCKCWPWHGGFVIAAEQDCQLPQSQCNTSRMHALRTWQAGASCTGCLRRLCVVSQTKPLQDWPADENELACKHVRPTSHGTQGIAGQS